MSDEIRSATITKLSIRNGLLIGGISIVLSLIFWVVNPLLQYTNTWVSLLMLVVVILLLVVLGTEVRKAVGGYWTFGEAFKSLFITSVLTAVLSVVFGFILLKFIDPTLPARVTEAVQANLGERFSNSGMSQDKIDEINKSLEGKFDPTFKNIATNLGIGIVVYIIIDLIIAAIIKKNPPIVMIVEEDPTV